MGGCYRLQQEPDSSRLVTCARPSISAGAHKHLALCLMAMLNKTTSRAYPIWEANGLYSLPLCNSLELRGRRNTIKALF